MAIINLLFIAGLGWAWQRGFVADMFGNDRSYMTYAAAALFVMGTLSCFARARKVSAILNVMKKGMTPQVNGVKFLEKNAHLDDIADYIVVVGLLGTAIGVVMMLAQFNAENLSDPAKGIMTVLLASEGLGTAFRSTIVSVVAWLWFRPSLRMLKTATVTMIEDAR